MRPEEIAGVVGLLAVAFGREDARLSSQDFLMSVRTLINDARASGEGPSRVSGSSAPLNLPTSNT